MFEGKITSIYSKMDYDKKVKIFRAEAKAAILKVLGEIEDEADAKLFCELMLTWIIDQLDIDVLLRISNFMEVTEYIKEEKGG